MQVSYSCLSQKHEFYPPFVVASMIETVAMQPVVLMVLLSVGKRVLPHVFTSAAVLDEAELILVSTNLNADAFVQEPVVAGKFTLTEIFFGRIGLEALKGVFRSASTKDVPRAA